MNKAMREFYIKKEDYITLQDLLKAESIVSSGGEAKMIITDGMVKVNSEIEIRRGKKLHDGDVVEIGDEKILIKL